MLCLKNIICLIYVLTNLTGAMMVNSPESTEMSMSSIISKLLHNNTPYPSDNYTLDKGLVFRRLW